MDGVFVQTAIRMLLNGQFRNTLPFEILLNDVTQGWLADGKKQSKHIGCGQSFESKQAPELTQFGLGRFPLWHRSFVPARSCGFHRGPNNFDFLMLTELSNSLLDKFRRDIIDYLGTQPSLAWRSRISFPMPQ